MAAAEVGDEQAQEDPTVNELQRRAAELLGHERALFLPTATMANQIALRVLTQPGRAADRRGADAHPDLRGRRAGGPLRADAPGRSRATPAGSPRSSSATAVATARLAPAGEHRRPRADAPQRRRARLAARRARGDDRRRARARARRPPRRRAPAQRLGRVRRSRPPSTARLADTVQICFSKGLGCPMGAILAGSEEQIEEAWRLKFLFGGALRQAGVVAAAMLYALDHNVERLAEDHARAKRLAAGPRGRGPPGRRRRDRDELHRHRRRPRSASTPQRRRRASRSEGVLVGLLRPGVLRVATHLGVTDDDVDRAIELIPRGAGRPCSSLTRSRRSSAPGRSSTASRASRRPSTAAARWPGARRSAIADASGAEATPDTQYRIGSISKTFTAAAVMLLARRGQARRSTTRSRAAPPGGAPRRPDDPPPARAQLGPPARAARRGLGVAPVPARRRSCSTASPTPSSCSAPASTSTTRTSRTRCSARSSRASAARRSPTSSTSG